MKKVFYLISLIVLFQSCSLNKEVSSFTELIGKWKVVEKNQEYIINIRKDSIFEMYSYENSIVVQYKIDKIVEDKLLLVKFQNETNKLNKSKNRSGFKVLKEGENPSPEGTKFVLNENQLTLIDIKTNKETKAINCNTGICDKQKDFFRKQGLNINLPEAEKISDANLDIRLTQNDIKIYLGKPKKQYVPIFGQYNRIWSSGKVIQTSDLPFLIAKAKPKELETKKGRIVLFIDSKVTLGFLKTIIEELTKNEIKDVYFALRKNQKKTSEFELVFEKKNIAELKFEQLDTNFITWIN